MPGSCLEEVVLSKNSEGLAIIIILHEKIPSNRSCVFQEKLHNLFKVTDQIFLWEANVHKLSNFLHHLYNFSMIEA